jgi:hypothetical protein
MEDRALQLLYDQSAAAAVRQQHRRRIHPTSTVWMGGACECHAVVDGEGVFAASVTRASSTSRSSPISLRWRPTSRRWSRPNTSPRGSRLKTRHKMEERQCFGTAARSMKRRSLSEQCHFNAFELRRAENSASVQQIIAYALFSGSTHP